MKVPKNLPRRKWLQITSLSAITGIASKFIGEPKLANSAECNVTPMQETGPFEPMKARKQADTDLDLTNIKGTNNKALGEEITIVGQVLDVDCNPIGGAIVEIWQANHHGKYNHEFDTEGQDDPNFQGWGSVSTDKEGNYRFKTILPGEYGNRTRHIHYKIQKRGYHELVTQLYFDGVKRNETDGIYNSLTHEEQQKVTISLNEQKKGVFNIHLKKVDTDNLPKKVLKAYVGSYRMHYEDTPMAPFLINQLQVSGKVVTDIILKGTQLYFDTPFSNMSEIFWVSKDRFNAKHFWDTEFVFERNNSGEITGFKMNAHSNEGGGVTFSKV